MDTGKAPPASALSIVQNNVVYQVVDAFWASPTVWLMEAEEDSGAILSNRVIYSGSSPGFVSQAGGALSVPTVFPIVD